MNDYQESLLISDEMYYADRKYMSNSALRLMRESPTKFDLWRKGLWSQPDTSAFSLGKAVHSAFLEGKDTAKLCDIRRDKRTQAYRDLLDESFGMNLLTASEYKDYQGMVAKLESIEELKSLMSFDHPDSGVSELAGFKEVQGIQFKAKADRIVYLDKESKYIVDLKTTAKSLEDFRSSARWLLYNQQAALYTEIFNADFFVFVVVEKTYPYDVGVFECSAEFMQRGQEELTKSIEMYKELFINEEYNPYSPRTFVL